MSLFTKIDRLLEKPFRVVSVIGLMLEKTRDHGQFRRLTIPAEIWKSVRSLLLEKYTDPAFMEVIDVPPTLHEVAYSSLQKKGVKKHTWRDYDGAPLHELYQTPAGWLMTVGGHDSWSIRYESARVRRFLASSPDVSTWLQDVVRAEFSNHVEMCPVVTSTRFHGVSSPISEDILRSTALMPAGRVILLSGDPGVGKSWIALDVASRLSVTRVLRAEGSVVPDLDTVSFAPTCRWLGVDVVIIDDFDKTDVSLHTMETLRKSTRLVILTANNGLDDRVIDGALARCGRIDESWVISPQDINYADEVSNIGYIKDWIQSNPGAWKEISGWPAAAMSEFAERLKSRGSADLRLDDIRSRLGMRCRSNGKSVDSPGVS